MDSEHVWIIDDDPVTLFYIQRLFKLTYPKTSVTTFRSAKTAFVTLREHEGAQTLPSIILLDIYMPVASGWDFISWYDNLPDIVRQKINLYIISSSIHPSDVMRAKAKRSVRQYFTKPLTQQTLKELML